jgi:hypothetical protein
MLIISTAPPKTAVVSDHLFIGTLKTLKVNQQKNE